MSSKKPEDKFSMYVPKEEPEQDMPDRLEVVDGPKGSKSKTRRMQGGAYDPYQNTGTVNPHDTARTRKPRVDLRKLSEWIKTTQRVKSQREDESSVEGTTPDPDDDSKEGR